MKLLYLMDPSHPVQSNHKSNTMTPCHDIPHLVCKYRQSAWPARLVRDELQSRCESTLCMLDEVGMIRLTMMRIGELCCRVSVRRRILKDYVKMRQTHSKTEIRVWKAILRLRSSLLSAGVDIEAAIYRSRGDTLNSNAVICRSIFRHSWGGNLGLATADT